MTELSLANGRRADVVGLSPGGDIWIVEIKSCLVDFQTDAKWAEYRPHCDRRYFAVSPDFPCHVIPENAGLMLADRYGGLALGAARRKAIVLTFPTLRRSGCNFTSTPAVGLSFESYFGARLARMRCSVRRCMLSRRAVSETLRLHSS